MYVCTYIYICICIHIHINVTFTCIYLYMHMFTYTHIYLHIHIHRYKCCEQVCCMPAIIGTISAQLPGACCAPHIHIYIHILCIIHFSYKGNMYIEITKKHICCEQQCGMPVDIAMSSAVHININMQNIIENKYVCVYIYVKYNVLRTHICI